MAVIYIYWEKKWTFDWTLISLFCILSVLLLFSFHQEYIEKIEPCSLCKWQRIFYGCAFVISPIGLLKAFNSFIRIFLQAIFLVIMFLSIYHALIQFGWIADHCVLNAKIENINEFIKMLDQPKQSCAEVKWHLFKIPASIWSIFISLSGLLFLIKTKTS